MEQKPFSVGVRIEHGQHAIDRAQYGEAADHPALGAADYKLAVHLPGGRSVYTFCMCPGGQVVCAASEPGGVVVNGMSRFARDGENANSALLVGVGPEDFGGDHPLAGVELQRRMEQAAYRAARAAGGAPYAAPAQTVGDFLAGRAKGASDTVRPTYARGVAWCDMRECLPGFVVDALAEALPLLDRRLHGFADPGAVMTGVETRSSSPVRIVRDEGLQAQLAKGSNASGDRDGAGTDAGARLGGGAPGTGLYPCGEGAGYAGGIMSAACDGLRVAQVVADAFGS
ncbi:MAG: NAD(P)/FAD-dependent oxidoreductase [Eggerthellaceae bacterium]